MLILHQYYDKRGVSIMNKKEVSEIKSLFKRDGGAIDRICGCLRRKMPFCPFRKKKFSSISISLNRHSPEQSEKIC